MTRRYVRLRGPFAAAAEHARQAILVDPGFWVGYMIRGQAYEQLGETDVALEALAIAARLCQRRASLTHVPPVRA